MNDSNTHPIQYVGLDLCGLADSLLKKLSPLDQLTENEINAIRAKIEDHETVVAIGKRQKKKSLVKLGSSIIDYIDQKCWCTSFQSKRYQSRASEIMSPDNFSVDIWKFEFNLGIF